MRPSAAQNGWARYQVLFDAFADDPERYEWCPAQVVEQRWPRRHLKAQIDLRLHERTGAAVANFPAVLEPSEVQLGLDATKDPYVSDFLALSESARARAGAGAWQRIRVRSSEVARRVAESDTA